MKYTQGAGLSRTNRNIKLAVEIELTQRSRTFGK